MENPFAEGESRIIRPPSTGTVIFGATGDLTHRKLIPALYSLSRDNYLPPEFYVVGVARTPLTDDQFRDRLYEAIHKDGEAKFSKKDWDTFARRVFYQPADASKPDDFKRLRERLESLSTQRSEAYNYLYYLATSPSHFGAIASQLKGAGLIEDPASGLRATRLVVEKPFGHDLNSARELNRILLQSFSEEQIFRIDHYLGKETVQNILVFRFANGIFEPLWNHNYVDHIQISVCESIGVENRASYFDQAGIMRDIVQNHLLQMLSLLCIEPPHSLSIADSIRDEKVKVLRSMRSYRHDDVFHKVVRGHYTSGYIAGKDVPGYLEEPGVAARSQTETYVAMKLEIDNWRWMGVPIYIRAGKRLPKKITEISIVFKQPPSLLFEGRQISELEPNVLAIQVQPNEGISIKMMSKPPGMRMRVRPVVMDFQYDESFGVRSPGAYERLLLDAMRGDATLFTRNDEIEEAWRLLSPVLDAWGSDRPPPLQEYEAGTWGPGAADQLLEQAGRAWRRI